MRTIELRTPAGAALQCRVADGFGSRFLGLMGRAALPAGEGMLFVPGGSIHTFFMRFTLDVGFLDADGTALRVVAVRPVATRPRSARHALRARAGRRPGGRVRARAGRPARAPGRSLAEHAPQRREAVDEAAHALARAPFRVGHVLPGDARGRAGAQHRRDAGSRARARAGRRRGRAWRAPRRGARSAAAAPPRRATCCTPPAPSSPRGTATAAAPARRCADRAAAPWRRSVGLPPVSRSSWRRLGTRPAAKPSTCRAHRSSSGRRLRVPGLRRRRRAGGRPAAARGQQEHDGEQEQPAPQRAGPPGRRQCPGMIGRGTATGGGAGVGARGSARRRVDLEPRESRPARRCSMRPTRARRRTRSSR